MDFYVNEMIQACIDRYNDPEMDRVKEMMGEDAFNHQFGNVVINPGRQCGKTFALGQMLKNIETCIFLSENQWTRNKLYIPVN